MDGQDKGLNIQEMNERLKSILQDMYKFQEQVLDIKMFMVYANEKGVYLDNGELLQYEDTVDMESIQYVIGYEKSNKSALKEDIATVYNLVKNQSGWIKDFLLSSGVLGTAAPQNLFLTAGMAIAGGFLLKSFVLPKMKTGTGAEQAESGEMQKKEKCFQAAWYWIQKTLKNRQELKNCYVPFYTVLYNYKDEECLQFCVFQPDREINPYEEKFYFLMTTLNLFACYIFFAGSITSGNRAVWDQLWNDEAIILNAAQQVLGEKCGISVTINNLGILSSMTYEGKALQGEILLGSALENTAQVLLHKPIEFRTENLRQICKLMQLCQFGYAMVLETGSGKITALVNVDKAQKDEKAVRGKISFLNGKGWYLHGRKDVLLEYRNGKFFIPENEIAMENMTGKLVRYFETSGIWEKLVSMIAGLAHGAMVIVTSEAEKESERLTGKDRGYKVQCKFDQELYSGFTCIDGALILNPAGDCEAFGVIIDGKAVVSGNVERGSRYNSAKNYIAWKKNVTEKKQSDAKYAAIVRSDDGNMDIFLMQ